MRFDEHPFERMNRLFQETNEMMWNSPMWHGSGAFRALPPFTQDDTFSVRTVEDGYVVMADLPGFEKEDLDIRFSDGVLTVRGAVEMTHDSPADEDVGMDEDGSMDEDAALPVTAQTYRHQRREVYEQVTIPDAVIEEEITARYHNGVLEINLPTEESHDDSDTHRIDIE